MPSGNAGKAFIKLQTEWLRKYNENLVFKGIALKVYMLLLMILLQKPSPASKSKEHTEALKRRIESLQKGELENVLQECRDIQHRIKPRKMQENVSQTFSKLMFQGKVHAALRFLSNESSRGILHLSDETLASLSEKHPSPADIKENSLLYGPIKDLRTLNFNISEQIIQEVANLTKGAAGPSGLDANQYQSILCSKQFNREGKDLRDQIATLAMKLAMEAVDPTCLEAYLTNRLILLDKNPGIRPTGVGEIL